MARVLGKPRASGKAGSSSARAGSVGSPINDGRAASASATRRSSRPPASIVKPEVKSEAEDGEKLKRFRGGAFKPMRIKEEVEPEPAGGRKVVSRPPLSKARRLPPMQVARPLQNTSYQKYFMRKNWAKRLVWRGVKEKTARLKKSDLICNPRGRIVSKKKAALSKRLYKQNNIDLWVKAAKEVRQERGLKDFVTHKKSGTTLQRQNYSEIRNRWLDLIAERVVSTVSGNPEMAERIRNIAAKNGS